LSAWPCLIGSAIADSQLDHYGALSKSGQLGDVHRDPPRLVLGEQLDGDRP